MSMRCKLLRKKELFCVFPIQTNHRKLLHGLLVEQQRLFHEHVECCLLQMLNVESPQCANAVEANTNKRRELKIWKSGKSEDFFLLKLFVPYFSVWLELKNLSITRWSKKETSVNKIKWFSILFSERLWKLWKQFKSWIYPWDVLLILYANAFKFFLWSIINCPTNKSSLLIQFNFSPRAHAYCCLIMAS